MPSIRYIRVLIALAYFWQASIKALKDRLLGLIFKLLSIRVVAGLQSFMLNSNSMRLM